MKRILVADDMEPTRERWARVAEENGDRWEIEIVASGQEAIDATIKGQFDLIILDVQMSHPDESLATTMKVLTGHNICIVLMTGVYSLDDLIEMINDENLPPIHYSEGIDGRLVFPKGIAMEEEEFLEALFEGRFHDLMQRCWFI